MKKNKKYNQGITLIALVITIIILLILAIVSIKLIWNGGIIKHAKNATEEYTVASEKEVISLAYQDYSIANISGNGDYTLQNVLNNEKANATVIEETNEYWLVKFNETGNQYKLYKNDQRIEKIESGGNSDNPENPQKSTLKVGDYVSYGKDLSSNYVSHWHEDESGYVTTGISRDISYKEGGWRVLKIDGNKITLISATASNPVNRLTDGENANGRLLLKGQQLYNNGVSITNRVCDVLYSIEGVGKARSINLNDINDLVGYTEPKNKTYTLIEANNLYYPVRYSDDNGSAIDSDTFKLDGFSRNSIGVNTSNKYVKYWNLLQGNTYESIPGYGIGIVKATNKLGVTDNSYEYNISDYTNDSMIKELILGSSKYPQNTYWIASRVVHYNGDVWFTMAYCNPDSATNITYDRYPYTSKNYGAIIINDDGTDNRGTVKNNQKSHFIRPVIELDASVTIDTTKADKDGDGVIQDGSFEQPWSIIKK